MVESNDVRLERVNKKYLRYRNLLLDISVIHKVSKKEFTTNYYLSLVNESNDIITINADCINMFSNHFYEPQHVQTNIGFGTEAHKLVRGDTIISISKNQTITIYSFFSGKNQVKVDALIDSLKSIH